MTAQETQQIAKQVAQLVSDVAREAHAATGVSLESYARFFASNLTAGAASVRCGECGRSDTHRTPGGDIR
jgi:hypothetical protein